MDEMRYERQIVIPQIGEEGQARLREARVLIIGAGGLGSPIALYLAAAGVGTLGLADPDQVSVSNLNRQILYTTDDIGRDKTAAAAERLRTLNPEVEVATYPAEIRSEGGPDLAAGYDLVVEACDALEAKMLVNEICVAAQVPLIWAAVSRFEGQMGVYVPDHTCRACVFPQTPEAGGLSLAGGIRHRGRGRRRDGGAGGGGGHQSPVGHRRAAGRCHPAVAGADGRLRAGRDSAQSRLPLL